MIIHSKYNKMQHRTQYIGFTTLLLAALSLLAVSCKKDGYSLPTASDKLQNEGLKRTTGPNIVGQQIEFAYAMALQHSKGKLVSCTAEASIAGAAGTWMENKSYFTDVNNSGKDTGVLVGTPSVTTGAVTTVTYTVDTSAATLRYYYVIPEDARGKTVTITFTAKSSDGESISTKMGPYTISNMDMTLNLKVTNKTQMYLSIADMAVYDSTAAIAHAGSIDLVYLYRSYTTSAFNHALVAPAANAIYLPDVILPAGVNRDAKLLKVFNLRDHNLAPDEQYGDTFIDDVDFQKIDLTGQPDYAINLKQDAGVWVETADGKYRAYVFVNKVATNTATLSMKRYTMNPSK
jgi:hypothetical protein